MEKKCSIISDGYGDNRGITAWKWLREQDVCFINIALKMLWRCAPLRFGELVLDQSMTNVDCLMDRQKLTLIEQEKNTVAVYILLL